VDPNSARLRVRKTWQLKDSRTLKAESELFMQDILYPPLGEVHWLHAVLGPRDGEEVNRPVMVTATASHRHGVMGHGCEGRETEIGVIRFLVDKQKQKRKVKEKALTRG
jgi:hypothetical protein